MCKRRILDVVEEADAHGFPTNLPERTRGMKPGGERRQSKMDGNAGSTHHAAACAVRLGAADVAVIGLPVTFHSVRRHKTTTSRLTGSRHRSDGQK